MRIGFKYKGNVIDARTASFKLPLVKTTLSFRTTSEATQRNGINNLLKSLPTDALVRPKIRSISKSK